MKCTESAGFTTDLNKSWLRFHSFSETFVSGPIFTKGLRQGLGLNVIRVLVYWTKAFHEYGPMCLDRILVSQNKHMGGVLTLLKPCTEQREPDSIELDLKLDQPHTRLNQISGLTYISFPRKRIIQNKM